MRGLRPSVSALLVVLVCFVSSASVAQTPLGRIAGVALDRTGAVVPSAIVTVTNEATGDKRTGQTGSDGGFVFPQVEPGSYSVRIEATGFRTASYKNVKVDPSQTYSLTVQLEVGPVTETIEVTAGQELVNTNTSEISNTVTQNQVLNLPLLGRNPIELIRLQAGVPGIVSATRNNTAINGGRPGWTQVTQDGINIQDNFIRNNSLDFVPNRPTSDTIREFSIITNNVGADSVGGTSQVRLITPSGSNAYHGSVYWYNRNSALAANTFFNKAATPPIAKPFLNQNQFGFRLGGPILREKLFFFGSYEGFRLRRGVNRRVIVPANDDYLQGFFRYAPPGGGPVVRVNVFDLIETRSGTRLPIDPQVRSLVLSRLPGASQANSFNCGDSTPTRILNSRCKDFNQSSPTDRDQVAFRTDYKLHSKHSLEFILQRFGDKDHRGDIDNVSPKPASTISTTTWLFVGAWRWTITPNLLNEFRAGDNSSTVPFLRGLPVPSFLFAPAANNAPTLTGLALTGPVTNFLDQGRFVTTRQYIDNASWVKANHSVQFGVAVQKVRPSPFNFAGTLPTVTLGFSPVAPTSSFILRPSDFPTAITQTDVNRASAYAAFLAGYITQVAQTFQVGNISSGFARGRENRRNFEYDVWSLHAQDNWRFLPNLTLRLGLKWEYWSPLREADGLGLLPVVRGVSPVAALLDPNGIVAPIPGRNLWKPDYNQFGPSLGFAWDPFKNGKTSVRGGYSLAFVNEDSVTASQNALNGNFGLVGAVTLINRTQTLQTGVPNIPLPTFQVPRTYAQQLTSAGPTAAAFLIQPDLRTPYAHQFNFSIQRELWFDTAVEARYVGTLGRGLWRGLDYNQQRGATNSAFLADFRRARGNLLNCGSVTAPPPCGQALTFFPTMDGGGALTNPAVILLIRTGEIGSLADFYVTQRAAFPNAPRLFLPNPNIYVANMLQNGASSDYHALQIEGRRRLKNGFSAQINYTWSKLLSDANGNSQARFEPFLDNARPELDRGRSEFHLTHVINSNFVYELPFGRNKQFFSGLNGAADRIVSGWSVSSIIRWQSGNPISILSGHGTFNRGGRSGGMTAFSTLSPKEIKSLLGLREVSGVLYWIDPRVINPATGRAVGADTLSYTPQFPGQVFYNPLPGEVGNLKRLDFDGPANFNWDFSAAKRTRITERIGTEFRADFFNLLNRTQFTLFGDFNINSTTFGRITNLGVANRIIQLSLRVDF